MNTYSKKVIGKNAIGKSAIGKDIASQSEVGDSEQSDQIRYQNIPDGRRAWAKRKAAMVSGKAMLLLQKTMPFLHYLLAVLLFTLACVGMYLGNTLLLPYGFPWMLVSLLVIVAVASMWGKGPAVLVLALSALFGDLVVPNLNISYFYGHDLSWHMRLVRTLLFAACGASVVALTHQARMMQARAACSRAVVGTLQRMILPERLAEVPGYDVAGVYSPAYRQEEVGGDFYDLFPLKDSHYGIMMGDVMGKGKEAAAHTALLRYSARALLGAGLGPAQVLRQMNAQIETEQLDFGMASLFFGVLDTGSGSFRYANAGHEPPLLRCASGQQKALKSTGPILGAGTDLFYEEQTVTLSCEDALLLMTDGVTEARNAQGEFLEGEALQQILSCALGLSTAEKSVTHLETAVQRFIGESSRDDISLLLLRRTA